MIIALARWPLPQSSRYLRALAPLPSAPLRCSSTSKDTTSESNPEIPDDTDRLFDEFGEARAHAEEERISPIFSEGSDVSKLSAIYRVLTSENSWRLTDSRRGVAKEYSFKNYTRCLDFVQSVGIQSKYLSHHPTMIIEPKLVKVFWTTHQPYGLSEKDLDMARFCDERANLLGGQVAATLQRQDSSRQQ